MFARETDILVLQEDKISYVLAGKNLLSDATGGSALTSVPEVLGTQIARIEEYGISNNPESFAQWGADKYFTDAKRGSVLQLKGTAYNNDQLTVISQQGMRTWFRDLFIDSFNTQKLGGFDPYMNEYVITSNETLLPSETICNDCGKTIAITVNSDNNFTSCIDLGEFVGSTDIDYRVISVDGTFNILVDYNGTTHQTGFVSTSGTLNFDKDSVNVQNSFLTIAASGSVSLELTTKCPQIQPITIILVTITNNSDAGLFTTNQYRWTDGTFNSPLHTQNVEFLAGTENPNVSSYLTIFGPQGGGVIPTNSSNVIMFNNTIIPDDFSFNPFVNSFKYLRTNTPYGNNTSDILDLLDDADVASPIISPSGGNTAYYADFNMPNVGDYLYLIWDYRHSTPIELCYGSTLYDSCCECEVVTPVWCYLLVGCSDGITYTAPISPFPFVVGDVVQFQVGGAGPIKCAAVVNTGLLVPDSEIVSPLTYDCEDPINCP